MAQKKFKITPILEDAMQGNKFKDISHTRFNDLAAKIRSILNGILCI